MSGIYTTEGIVLKSFKYKESSIIADIYTCEHGLRSYIIGGVRSKKNNGRANVLHPTNIVEITAYPSTSDKLARIKEINYAYNFRALNQKVIPSAVGSFIIEVCRNSIKEKEPNPKLFNFLKSRIIDLDSEKYKLSLFHLKFLLELSSYLGFAPYNNYNKDQPYFDLLEGNFVDGLELQSNALDEYNSKQLSALISASMGDLSQLKMDKSNRDQLLDNILKFYSLHIDGFKSILSLDILRTILS